MSTVGRTDWASATTGCCSSLSLPPTSSGVHMSRIPTIAGRPLLKPDTDLPKFTDWAITHYSGEFCVAADFDPAFVAALWYEGYLTIASRYTGQVRPSAPPPMASPPDPRPCLSDVPDVDDNAPDLRTALVQ